MIVVVGGTKGGSGKTLLATNLTVMRTEQQRDVLLIDADEQASATLFTRQRRQTKGIPGYTSIQSFEADVVEQVRNLKSKYDDIVIDVGGRDTASQRAAITVAEIFVMPFAPTSVDLWTDDTVIKLLKEARPFNPNLRAYAVINKAFPSGSDNIESSQHAPGAPRLLGLSGHTDRQSQGVQHGLWQRTGNFGSDTSGYQGTSRNEGALRRSIPTGKPPLKRKETTIWPFHENRQMR